MQRLLGMKAARSGGSLGRVFARGLCSRLKTAKKQRGERTDLKLPIVDRRRCHADNRTEPGYKMIRRIPVQPPIVRQISSRRPTESPASCGGRVAKTFPAFPGPTQLADLHLAAAWRRPDRHSSAAIG